MLFAKETIVSLTKLTLTISGMRAIEEYEIVCTGDACEIARYTRFYADENSRRLIKSAAAATDTVIQLLNDCQLLRWDGFRGANPRWVRDGYMFLLTAEVNDGRRIRAEGSNNYPRHYHAFKTAVNQLLEASDCTAGSDA